MRPRAFAALGSPLEVRHALARLAPRRDRRHLRARRAVPPAPATMASADRLASSSPAAAAASRPTGANHPSLALVCPIPSDAPPFALERASSQSQSSSAFASGDRLVAGVHFNALRWDPVACSRFLDDRPWRAVERFALRVVRGDACLSDLHATLEPARVCSGPGVNVNTKARLGSSERRGDGRRPRYTYRVPLAYHGPAFAGWSWTPNDAPLTERTVTVTTETETDAEENLWTPGAYSVAATAQAALATRIRETRAESELELPAAEEVHRRRPPNYRKRPNTRGDDEGARSSLTLAVAGRTDRGVNGAAQCVSFWSYDRVDVREAIARCDAGVAGLLRVLDPPDGVLLAPTRAFHATFCATWRRYVYVFPLRQAGLERPRTPTLERRLDVGRADAMLRKLVERSAEAGGVDCAAFARDADPARDATCVFKVARAFESAVPRETPEEARESHVEMMIGRGEGEASASALALARASARSRKHAEAAARARRREGRGGGEEDDAGGSAIPRGLIGGDPDPDPDADADADADPDPDADPDDPSVPLVDPYADSHPDSEPVMVVELVANRFVRKLVRVLVATAAREAAAGAADDVLLALAATRERAATAAPAPPQGLFLAGVGYGDHPEWDERGEP